MKKPEDILKQSIEALKKTDVPPGPAQELIESTIAQIKTADVSQHEPETTKIADRLKFAKGLIKYAAAAVILISTGYFTARLSAPKAPDVQQLQAALEPAIRQKLLMEITQYLQGSLAGSFTQLKDELQQQYRRDLSDFAIQTLAASSAVTNQRLEELIDAINTAQMEDRRSVATALRQIELNRRQDNSQLAAGLQTLALQTEDQFQQTRQDIVKLLSNSPVDSLIPNKFKNSTNK